MKEFTLDDQFLCSISIHKKWNSYTINGHIPTDEELLWILQGKGNCSSISTDDHPEFATLRNQLDTEGYIATSRNSWNGDYTLKKFKLNGVIFEKDSKFPSGAAIRSLLTRESKKTK